MKHQLLEIPGQTMKRLICIAAFDEVEKGQLGGLIAPEVSLGEGNWWVDYSAVVDGDSHISEDVRISGNAYVLNSALRGFAEVLDNACVISSDLEGKTVVSKMARVIDCELSDCSIVSGNAYVEESILKDNSCVRGSAVVMNCEISGITTIGGETTINDCSVENGTLNHNCTLEGLMICGDYVKRDR